MLKVVGASWEQTRVSWYILGAFTLFGLIIIIFGSNVKQFEEDGNFAATVFWKKEVGYRIEFWGQGNVLLDVPMGVARGYHKQDIAQTGWSTLELETNSEYPDHVQAYAAGLLEGSLTWLLVYWRWKNTIEVACDKEPEICGDIRAELELWSENVRNRAKDLSVLEPFWHQIHLFFCQVDGLTTGWNYSVKRSREKDIEIDDIDFLWLNFLTTDIPLPDTSNLVPETPSLSSVLIKIREINNSSEILLAHTTANAYRDMLRIVKRYVFNYHLTGVETSSIVPGNVLEFTGYPGAVSSQDDFYSVYSDRRKHNLLVTGSTLGCRYAVNDKFKFLRRKRNIDDHIFGSMRALIATRLSPNTEKWAAYFRIKAGISIDKQWQIIDVSKINNKETKGILRIVEQARGVIMASDESKSFRTNSYWACYGIPIHDEIRLALNKTMSNDSPREKAFKQCHQNCNTKEELFHITRTAVPVDEFLQGARPDLYRENPTAFGVIDTKIITISEKSSITFELTAGPVHSLNYTWNYEDSIAPFQWSTSPFFGEAHNGQPDIWNYPTMTPKWAGY